MLLLLVPSLACFSEVPPTSDEAETDADDTSADASGEQSSSDTADAGTGSTGDTDDSAGDSSTGEPAGYPGDVTDVLDLPWPPDNYADPDLPEHFQSGPVEDLDNTPADNPVTDSGATLGRVLFYDTALSANDTIACASCHKQDEGFSDNRQFSVGFEGGDTGRNSMGIVNSAYYDNGRFFWDERADTLEDQVLLPIQDAVEMGMTLEGLVAAVEGQAYYGPLFEQAFGDAEVTTERISFALAQFVRAMVSTQSLYDEGIEATGDPNVPFPNFTEQQNLGKQLFFGPQGNCAICHVAAAPGVPQPGQPRNLAIFQPLIAINNGLDMNPEDEGAGGGRFKSHSLRNIAQSGPYMHDGRFQNLLQVVEHYDNGVQGGPDTDPRLMPGGQPQNLGLDDPEKQAIVAFLETLTDEVIMQDPRFSDPFK
ncbi:MAG: cytochrome c peroxidase [Nannocystales bacterium]